MLSGMSLWCRDVVGSFALLEILEAVETLDRDVGARRSFRRRTMMNGKRNRQFDLACLSHTDREGGGV